MKKLCLLSVLIFLAGQSFLGKAQVPEACRFNSAAWISKAPMPEARAKMVSGVIDGKIYATCGYTDFGRINTAENMSSVYVYDPEEDTWDTTGTPIPYYRDVVAPGSSALGGKLYVVGGIEWEPLGDKEWLATPVARVDAYDPLTDSWDLRAYLPEPLGGYAICALEGKLYVTGGVSGQTPDLQKYKNLYMYDPSLDKWKAKADMNSARGGHVALACNGKIYVFSGNSFPNVGTAAEVYDPELDKWTEISSMPYGIIHSEGCVIDNEIYLFGGRTFATGVSYSARLLKYNPDKDQWSIYGYMKDQMSTYGKMPGPNWNHTICAIGDRVYMIGGHKIISGTTDSQFRTSEYVDEFVPADLVLEEILPDRAVEKHNTISMDLSQYFSHKDGEQISYTVCTSKDEVVSDSLDGHMLFLKGMKAGKVQVHVRAESENDESGYNFSVEVTPGVSVQEDASHLFHLFPNPAGDLLTIDLGKPGPCDYLIYSAAGQQVQEGILTGSSQTLDISTLDRGVYFLKINSPEPTVPRKFVKL